MTYMHLMAYKLSNNYLGSFLNLGCMHSIKFNMVLVYAHRNSSPAAWKLRLHACHYPNAIPHALHYIMWCYGRC